MKTIYYILFAALIVSCSNSNKKPSQLTKDFLTTTPIELDAIPIEALIAPSIWYADGNNIVAFNPRADDFVNVLDKHTFKLKTKLARKGNGPNEYTTPTIILGSPTDVIHISQTSPQKNDSYRLVNDTTVEKLESHYTFPRDERITAITTPKLYSFIHYVDRNRVIGSAFDGFSPIVDVVNMAEGKEVSNLKFTLEMDGAQSASPFIFNADYFNTYFAIAYEYINRIELYKLVGNDLKLQYVIGDTKTQEELFHQGKLNEMMNYYSGVAIGGDRLYALYYGELEGDVYGDKAIDSYIEVYDLKSGEPLERLEVRHRLSKMMADREAGRLLFINPDEERSMVLSMDI